MKLVGSYTKDIRDAIEAGVVSGQNVMFISPPGYGKTTTAIMAGQAMTRDCDGGFVFLPLDPSTPPERLLGTYDPVEMLHNGKMVRMNAGTVYDPKGHIFVLDEIFRANDIACDILLHAIEDKFSTMADRKVFIGTSNHVGKAERVEAFRDRFALWVFIYPELGAGAVSEAYLNSMLSNGLNPYDNDWIAGLPVWMNVQEVRSAKPTPKSIKAITEMVTTLSEEAAQNGFVINPRREVQWSELLFRTTVWKTGTADFNEIPNSVSRLLQFAYPLTDKAMAAKWKEVSMSVFNTVASAIEAIKANAYQEFSKVVNTSGRSKQELFATLGAKLAQYQAELFEKFGDRAEVTEANQQLTDMFSKAVRGEKLGG